MDTFCDCQRRLKRRWWVLANRESKRVIITLPHLNDPLDPPFYARERFTLWTRAINSFLANDPTLACQWYPTARERFTLCTWTIYPLHVNDSPIARAQKPHLIKRERIDVMLLRRDSFILSPIIFIIPCLCNRIIKSFLNHIPCLLRVSFAYLLLEPDRRSTDAAIYWHVTPYPCQINESRA